MTGIPLADGIDLSGRVIKTSPWHIGMGTFADVYQGEMINPSRGEVKSVAIKVFRGAHRQGASENLKAVESAKAQERRLKNEAKLWSMLDHPNVLKYLGYCNSSDVAPSIAMISPLCKNGTVSNYLENAPGVDRLRLIKQIMDGLCYLHNYPHDDMVIVHGDLHCNNILINDDGNALLSGFCRAQVVGDPLYITTLLVGHAEFMAPELFPPLAIPAAVYTPMSDIYAYVMIVYEIYTGVSPFSSYYNSDYCSEPKRSASWVPDLLKKEKRPKRSADISDSLWRLMERCWGSDPDSRPSALEVVRILQGV